MIKKVHISRSNKATFICPKCIKTKTVDVSRYVNQNRRTTVKSKCTCGCTWTSILERRKRYRMAVNIPCTCRHVVAGGNLASTAMRVVDISSSGLKIKPHNYESIDVSQYFPKHLLIIDFDLGDNHKTHIRKTVYTRHIDERQIGVEFDDSQHGDQTIGSYILSQRHHQAIM